MSLPDLIAMCDLRLAGIRERSQALSRVGLDSLPSILVDVLQSIDGHIWVIIDHTGPAVISLHLTSALCGSTF